SNIFIAYRFGMNFYRFAKKLNMLKYSLTIVLLSAFLFSFSQQLDNARTKRSHKIPYTVKDTTYKKKGDISLTPDTGRVEIFEDRNIGVLIKKYNKTRKDMGYRVQIHSGVSRGEAIKAQTDFISLYPNVPTYLIYQQPNFKIRVGDFEDRLSVNRFYDAMINSFPGSFIIQDEINFQP